MKSIEQRIQELATSLKIEVDIDHFIEHRQNDNGEDSVYVFDPYNMHFPYMNGDFSFLKNYKKLISLKIDVDQEINIASLKDCTLLEYLNINFQEDFTNKINFNGDYSFPNVKNLSTGSAIIESNNSLSFLKKFPNLEHLEIDLQNITDIVDLGKLSKLTSLSLHQGTFSSIDIISKLTHLEQLYLNSKNITDISPLKKWTKLKHLSLHGCNFSDISVLSNFKDLKTLSLKSNKIHDINILRNLSTLKTIDLSNNAVKSIDSITELPNLDNINFSNNEITEIPLFKNSKIVHAYFANNSISSIENLTTINSLQYLDVTDNHIKKIIQLPKNLVQLHANNNQTEELQAGNHQHLTSIHCENHSIKKPKHLSINTQVLSYINLKQKSPSSRFLGEYYKKDGEINKKICYHLFKTQEDYLFKDIFFDMSNKTYEKLYVKISCKNIWDFLLNETSQTFENLSKHIDTFIETKEESNRIYYLVDNKEILEYTSDLIAFKINNAKVSEEEKQKLNYKLLYKVYPTTTEKQENTISYSKIDDTKNSKNNRFINNIELFFWILGIVSFFMILITLLKIFLFR